VSASARDRATQPRRLLVDVGEMRRVRHPGAGRADEAVGDPAGPAGGSVDAGADPQRRPRLLIGARTDLDILERVVLATERKRLARPAQAQDLDAFLEPPGAILHGDGEGAEVGGLIADAHAQDDAPLGDEVERDHVLGHVHRVVERQQDHGGADA